MLTTKWVEGERYHVPIVEREDVPPHQRFLNCADDCARICGNKRYPRGKVIRTAEGELRNTLFEEAVPSSLMSARVSFRGYHYGKDARDYPPFGWSGREEVILRCQFSLSEREEKINELDAKGMIPPEARRIERILEH